MLCDSVPRMIPFFPKIGFFSTNDNENDNVPSWAMGGSHRAMAFVSPFDAISRQTRYGPAAPQEHGVLGASPIAVRRCVLGASPIAAAKKRRNDSTMCRIVVILGRFRRCTQETLPIAWQKFFDKLRRPLQFRSGRHFMLSILFTYSADVGGLQ